MGLFDYAVAADDSADLNEITLLADLSDEDWSRVLRIVEIRHFKTGEDLVRIGDRDESFYILTSGSVDVVVEADGRESVLAAIYEGSVFGELAFFDDAPRSATIRARSRGSAVRVTRENYESLAAWEPEIARTLLFDLGRVLAMRLRWTTQRASN
jgi:CRP/FNR family transcriptional regulator, cyclic AMP receptor protein